MEDSDIPDCDTLIPLCDGILLIAPSPDAGAGQNKGFTTLDIDQVARSVDPDLLHDDLDDQTLLSYVIGEFSYGRRVTFNQNSPDPFDSWKQDEDIGTYPLWEHEDELHTLLVHLKDNAAPSGPPPSCPLIVVCS